MKVAYATGIFLVATVAGSALAAEMTIPAGSSRVVEQITRLNSLVIGTDSSLMPSKGHSLTMTVNGVQTALRPGSYRGNIVLTPTKEVLVKSASVAPHPFRAALYVDGGHVIADRSVAAAVVGGVVTDKEAKNISVTSRDEAFNAVVVTGDSKYVLTRPQLDLVGNGGDDTDGFGAGILVSGHSDVTLNSPTIRTRGAIRTALFVSGDGTLRVNHASIEVFPGTLPPGYQPNIGDGRVMMEVPWMLGLSGNVRATNVTERGTVYYNRSTFKSHGWGVLSTDGVERVRMEVRDSTIETVDGGYGAYALGDAVDTFYHCLITVDDYGLIVGGAGSGIFTDGTHVRSRRYGIMLHQGGGGAVTIDKGSSFETGSTLIEVKGRGTTITVDNARLHAGNGVLLQTMDNDDPFMKAMAAKGPMPGGAMPGDPAAHKPQSNNVVARFSHVELKGDLIHGMGDLGEMQVTLGEGATLEGAVSSATTEPASGADPTRETYRTIGAVRNTLGPAGPHGVGLELLAGAVWTVTKTSYLSHLVVSSGATVHGTGGRPVALRVNGQDRPMKAGTYDGQVVLSLSTPTP